MLSSVHIHLQPVKAHSILRNSGFPEWMCQVAITAGPKYLIRDRDTKFGPCFARVATTSGIEILKTPYQAPRANTICERFLGSVRRECLDHLFILQEKQLDRVLCAYVEYFNRARPQEAHHTTDSRTVWKVCPSTSQ